MKSFRNIIKEEILKEVSYTLLERFIPLLIEYVKHFGDKGKLESNSTSLKRYYEPYLEDAYKWASEKLDDVKRNGFPYFKHLFEVDVNNNVKINKRGLIYVERDIAFDVTEDLTIKDYKSIGEC